MRLSVTHTEGSNVPPTARDAHTSGMTHVGDKSERVVYHPHDANQAHYFEDPPKTDPSAVITHAATGLILCRNNGLLRV